MKYEEYINSESWLLRRQVLLAELGSQCELCPRKNELQIHHLNYDRLGCEEPEDVMVLCVRCHNDLHYALRQFPASESIVRKSMVVTQEQYMDVKKQYV